jgi:hypothetical protein
MTANLVFIGLVALLAVAYRTTGLLSHQARRRRDARALRAHLLREIAQGHRSADEEVVAVVLNWCEAVIRTGRDLPMTGRDQCVNPDDRPITGLELPMMSR